MSQPEKSKSLTAKEKNADVDHGTQAFGATLIPPAAKAKRPSIDDGLDTPFAGRVAKGDKLIHPSAFNHKLTAPIWKHFHIFDGIPKEKQSSNPGGKCKYACCNHCGEVCLFKDKNGKTTQGAIKPHLQSKHRISNLTGKVAEAVAPPEASKKVLKQPTLLGHTVPCVPPAEKAKQERWKVCRWILDTNQPFSAVEEDSFRDLPIAPSCQDMDNKTVKDMLMDKEAEIRRAIRGKLDGQVVSITLDHWTSKASHNYVAITVHWIDADWKLQSEQLGCFLHACVSTP